MRKVFYLISFLVFIIFITFLIFILAPKNDEQKTTIVSPLPASPFYRWLPALENYISAGFSKPETTARSVLVFDTTSEKVLYEKNSKAKVPMASLTKIMTAIIALENPKKDNKYIVHSSDLVGEDSMGLTSGEVLTLKELMYGMILHSGNDAAEVFASNFKGGRTGFLKTMNDKVKSLGLSNTNFTNPTGLEGDGDQHTTAYDLMVITRFALVNFPLFAEVSKTFDINIVRNSNHKQYILENETNLLSSYPGVKGVKTGYTPEAGLCLVTYLDYGGHKIIAVILGSENRRQEMKDLLDYSLKSLGITPPLHG